MEVGEKKEFDGGTFAVDKMTQNRNRELDKQASTILVLVHVIKLALVDPIKRGGHHCVTAFADNFPATIIYLLVYRGETFKVTEKFMADMSPSGKVKCIRSGSGAEFTKKNFKIIYMH